MEVIKGYTENGVLASLSFHFQVLIAGTFKGMKIKAGAFGKASPEYDVQVYAVNRQQC